ncbi:MAG TPA: GAF domain-containing protein, partial [Allocoleopsis sp.]
MTLDLPQEVLIHRITNKIRQSLELQEILTTTTAEIRAFLKTDRVIIYRFHPDESGEVIAESMGEKPLPSLLGLNFPADDIPVTTKERIIKTRQRAIIHVDKKLTGISILESLETGESIPKIEINYRPSDPCHLEYLMAMGVKFSLSVPIFAGEKLWGLLVAHHGENREITTGELEFIQTVADQVSLAIAQANILSLARSQAHIEATINKIGTLLHDQPTIELQKALEETVLVFQSCGGRIYILSTD